MAFEKGHTHGRKNKGKKGLTPSQKVDSAIKKVLVANSTEGDKSLALFNLFNRLYKDACAGDVVAHREFMDRYAGKVSQKVEAEFTQYLVQIGSEELQIKEVEEQPLVIENKPH